MAWTSVHAWLPGEIATAAQMNVSMRDNELALYSGRPSLSIANGTVGSTGGTAYIAGVMGTIDCIFTTDSAADCWDLNWGFTPSGSAVVFPEMGYYFLNACQACADASVAAEHVTRIVYQGTVVAVMSTGSTAAFGPTHCLPMLQKMDAPGGGTVKQTYRRGGGGTITNWFGFQAVQLRGL